MAIDSPGLLKCKRPTRISTAMRRSQPIAVIRWYFGDMVLISGLFICDNCHLVWA